MAELTSGSISSSHVSNAVYFTSEVDKANVNTLVTSLRDLEHNLLVEQVSLGLKKPRGITLYVNSFGGYTSEGMRAVDVILNLRVPTTSVVEGWTASAGTFISLACQTRKMTKHSQMLIHELRGWSCGTIKDIKDDVALYERLQKQISAFYAERTKFSKADLKKILKKDIWFDSKKCLKVGLVDEII